MVTYTDRLVTPGADTIKSVILLDLEQIETPRVSIKDAVTLMLGKIKPGRKLEEELKALPTKLNPLKDVLERYAATYGKREMRSITVAFREYVDARADIILSTGTSRNERYKFALGKLRSVAAGPVEDFTDRESQLSYGKKKCVELVKATDAAIEDIAARYKKAAAFIAASPFN